MWCLPYCVAEHIILVLRNIATDDEQPRIEVKFKNSRTSVEVVYFNRRYKYFSRSTSVVKSFLTIDSLDARRKLLLLKL